MLTTRAEAALLEDGVAAAIEFVATAFVANATVGVTAVWVKPAMLVAFSMNT